MSITKEIVLDQIMVTTDGTLQCRQATRIMEDGKELTKTYHRFTLVPGQDLTDQPEKVIAIAQAAWTPEVIAAYAAAQQQNQPE